MLELRDEAEVKCLGTETSKCQPLKEACLFNILKDPCEQRNLAKVYGDFKIFLFVVLACFFVVTHKF